MFAVIFVFATAVVLSAIKHGRPQPSDPRDAHWRNNRPPS